MSGKRIRINLLTPAFMVFIRFILIISYGHTAATAAIAGGADVKSVQDMPGHATASFTLNVYAHTSEQMMKDTAARLQSYYDTLAVKGQTIL